MNKYNRLFTIVEKHFYGQNYFKLELESPTPLPDIEAGQFVEVAVANNKEVFLRRPISIHDVDETKNRLSLLIQIVGKGTRSLSAMKVGDCVDMVFPLGRGFRVAGEKVMLVGGGAGVAPLLLLAKKFNEQGIRPTILLGGRSSALIPAREVFEQVGRVGYATENGELGEHGLVTQHSWFADDYDHIYTCGPTPMMKAVARHAAMRGISCQVSLENMMACGLGACLCCVVDSDEGHKCVCKEGPVFDIEELQKWINN